MRHKTPKYAGKTQHLNREHLFGTQRLHVSLISSLKIDCEISTIRFTRYQNVHEDWMSSVKIFQMR